MRRVRGLKQRSVCVGLIVLMGSVGRVGAQAVTEDTRRPAAPESVSGTDAYAQVVQAAVEAYNHDDFATARRYFARAHELRPSARTWRGLGTTAFELKDYEDAVRELTFALEDERSALPTPLRAETERTLRVARRTLAERAQPEAAGRSEDKPAKEQSRAEKREVAAPVQALNPQPTAAAASSSGIGGQRVAALIVASAGLAGVGVGIAFGVRSISKGDERDRLCPDKSMGCSGAAVRAADAALAAGDISTVAWVAGAVAIAGGAALWLTGAPSERATTTRLAIGPGGVSLSGTF
jgi:hypothetical protein